MSKIEKIDRHNKDLNAMDALILTMKKLDEVIDYLNNK